MLSGLGSSLGYQRLQTDTPGCIEALQAARHQRPIFA